MKTDFIRKTISVLFLSLGFGFIFSSCDNDVPGPNVDVGEVSVLTIPSGMYFKGYWPDGKLCVVKKDTDFIMFWGEANSVRTEASTAFPEDHINKVISSNVVFGKDKAGNKITGVNENGSWFIGVFPLDDSGNYVGFFHGESHWSSDGMAHKSICVAYSEDYGVTWKNAAPIITDTKKPETPSWSGLGDGCVIRDKVNGRWICYYQGKVSSGSNALCMAVSYDANGASGTWKKWDGSDFTVNAYDSQTGNGGKNIAIKNLKKVPGCNPSVMWNSYLNMWIMTYASWGKQIYISQSSDAINWSTPVAILGTSGSPAWYPNMISEEGDAEGGKEVQLYFSHNQGADGKRNIGKCTLTFEK